MKRVVTLVGLVILVAAAVAVVERVNEDRRYRRLLAEGEQALDLGHSYAAIEAFSGALALRPASMVAFYRRGEAYGQQGQFDTAIRDLRTARALAPDARQPLEALGRLYDRRGNYAESARWYAQANGTLNDADPALLYSLALARYRSGDPAGARDPLRLAVASDDSMARAHYLLGLVYRDSQEPAEAIASLLRAVTFDPHFLAAREELADLYRALGRPEDEKAQLVALSAAEPRLQRSLALGLAEVRAGQFGAARTTLAAIDATSPGDSRIAIAIGRLYLARAERGDDAEAVTLALSALETALSGTARRSEGLALYGRALFLAGDIRGAERLLQQAVLTTPVVTEAFAYLADAAERLGNLTEARDALLRLDALEGDTALPAVRTARALRIGSLALAADDPTTAARFLAAAVADGHADAHTLGLYSRARWALGDPAGARETLTQALARDPHDRGLLSLAQSFR